MNKITLWIALPIISLACLYSCVDRPTKTTKTTQITPSMAMPVIWDSVPTQPLMRPAYFEVDDKTLQAACAGPWERVIACARRDFATNTCEIFTAPNPPQFVIEHEKKHCRGYEHD